ncbi:MAG: sulfurtransferase TusA family protein [Candidatus Thorarchaeota archaeon]|nr:MAG: sulfurtransferase TusA family protein [Candidatus Thorarchaeota archaeon]
MTELEPIKTLDCVGLFCPQPIFEVKKGINSIEVGQVLEMLADDPGAEEDMKRWAKRTGHELLSIERLEDGVLRFLFRRMK